MFTYNGNKIKGAWIDNDGTKYPPGWVNGVNKYQLIDMGVETVEDIIPPLINNDTHFNTEQADGTYTTTAYSQEIRRQMIKSEADRQVLDRLGSGDLMKFMERILAKSISPSDVAELTGIRDKQLLAEAGDGGADKLRFDIEKDHGKNPKDDYALKEDPQNPGNYIEDEKPANIRAAKK